MSPNKYTYYLSSTWKLLTGIKPWSKVLRVFLTPSTPADLEIELRATGLHFLTRNVMDIWSVKETFLDRFYEKFGAPIGDGWSVIDIGGGIGDFTIFVAAQNHQNSVYAFEPTPGSFALLQENLKLNTITNVQAYSNAIWSQSSEVLIDTTTGQPGQFTSQAAGDQSSDDGKIKVPALSLQDAFERTGLARCNLLKVDCEGAEYEIFFNTPDDILGRIERIIMEYHDNPSGHTHRDLAQFFTSKGFAVKTYPNYVHSHLGYLYAAR